MNTNNKILEQIKLITEILALQKSGVAEISIDEIKRLSRIRHILIIHLSNIQRQILVEEIQNSKEYKSNN